MKSLIIKLFILILMLMISGVSRAQWTKTNGPNGGYIVDFVMKDSSIFAAAGSIGGIFRSNDNGISWTTVDNGLPDSYGDPSYLAVIGNTIFAGGYSLGLYRSSNNGNSWENITNNIEVSFISELHVHNGILFAGTYGAGVYRSSDNGNSFQRVNNGFGAFAFISAFASAGNLLYTGLTGNGGTAGVYVTSNAGDQWVQVINGLPSPSHSTQALTTMGTDVYAAASDKGIFKTTNNGSSWFPVNNGIPMIINGGVNILEARNGIIYAGMNGGEDVFKSTDNGASWIRISQGLPVQTTGFAILIQDTFVLYGSQNAVYRSTNNGSSWSPSYKGIANTVVTDLLTDGNNIYAATMPGNDGYGEGVSVTPDNGNNWGAANGRILGNISVYSLARNGSTLFAGTIFGIYRSTNAGVNWQRVDSTGFGAGVQKMIVFNNIIFAATYGEGIRKSTDNGTTWQFTNAGLGDNVTVYDLMVDGNTIYAGVFWGVYASTNNGNTWINKSTGIYPGSTVYSLIRSGSNLLAGTHRGLYLSSNNGSNWNEITSSQQNPIHDFTVSGNDVYAAADSGIYKSTDHGYTWLQFSEGLPRFPVLSILTVGNDLYAGTDGRGVWRYSLNDLLTLNLKALIQGFYDPAIDKMIRDTVKVYLRNTTSPYQVIDSAKALLDSNGSGSFIFANASAQDPYYIVITHRNGLETWSSSGQNFASGNLSYDFTLSSSQAYGNNLILKGSKYCIYSGDASQDDVIDITDLIQTYNAASNFSAGYLSTDANGDNFTDVSDLIITYNNSAAFVSIRRP